MPTRPISARCTSCSSRSRAPRPQPERRRDRRDARKTAAARRSRGAIVSAFGAPPIDGLGTTGGFKLIVEDRGNLGLDRTAAGQRPDRRPRQRRPTGLPGPVQQLRRQHALAVPRHRPHQVHGPRRAGQRRLQHAAGLPGLVLRQQLQRVRPHLAGQRPGRPALSAPTSRHPAACRCRNNQGQMVPPGHADGRARHERAGDGHALQHVSRPRPSPATPAPRHQLRPGDRA